MIPPRLTRIPRQDTDFAVSGLFWAFHNSLSYRLLVLASMDVRIEPHTRVVAQGLTPYCDQIVTVSRVEGYTTKLGIPPTPCQLSMTGFSYMLVGSFHSVSS